MKRNLAVLIAAAVLAIGPTTSGQGFDDRGWTTAAQPVTTSYQPQPVRGLIRGAVPHGFIVGVDGLRAERAALQASGLVPTQYRCLPAGGGAICSPIRQQPQPVRVVQPQPQPQPVQVGPMGPQGPAGIPGSNGAAGESAYQIAVRLGFKGSEADWLASLKGPPGTRLTEVDYDRLAKRLAVLIRRDIEAGLIELPGGPMDPEYLAEQIRPHLPDFALTINGRRRSAPLGGSIDLNHQRRIVQGSTAQEKGRTDGSGSE